MESAAGYGLYKTELVHPRRPWSSLKDLELATLEYVWWFNNHRLLEPIGDLPPLSGRSSIVPV